MIYEAKYDCIYIARGKGGASPENLNKDFYIPLGHYACFGDIYRKLRDCNYAEVIYKIYLYKENLPGKNFNLCNKLETKKILRCLQKTVPFSYKFEEGKFDLSDFNNKETDFNVLVVSIKGNFAQHLWVTTMLRCFFEWPYNVAAKEACILQSEIKEAEGLNLSKENWINLYLTIAAQLGSDSLHGIVDLGKHPKAKTYHEWKQKLESIKGAPSIINSLRVGGSNFKNAQYVGIHSEREYQKGIQSRAARYVAAYKDKLSWKN